MTSDVADIANDANALTDGCTAVTIDDMTQEAEFLTACLVIDLVRYASARCPR